MLDVFGRLGQDFPFERSHAAVQAEKVLKSSNSVLLIKPPALYGYSLSSNCCYSGG